MLSNANRAHNCLAVLRHCDRYVQVQDGCTAHTLRGTSSACSNTVRGCVPGLARVVCSTHNSYLACRRWPATSQDVHNASHGVASIQLYSTRAAAATY